jgi:copper chaperone CopZ
MMKYAIVLAVAATLAMPAMAAEPCKEEMITVKASGLICDFCARSVEKTFTDKYGVSKAHVDLDKGEVHLMVDGSKTLPDDKINELMKDAGYDVTGISRACS